jgi:hypothetical protein
MEIEKFQKTIKCLGGIFMLVGLLIPVFSFAVPDLQVEFSANPNSGTAPLSNVDLTATVSGTATGPITYKFDCTNDGVWDKIVTTNNTSYTAVDLCSYSSPGNYLAKVSVGRNGLFFEGITAIMVKGDQNLSVTLSATPSSGTAPLQNVDLNATVSGNANEGTITYQFDCNGDGTWEHTRVTNSTTYTATDVCQYENPGSYTARVKVERGGLSFIGTTVVQVLPSNNNKTTQEGSLTIEKTVRNITKGETNWKLNTSAAPGDLLEFRIKVGASGKNFDDVVVRDIIPGQTTFAGNLQINGSPHSGDIQEGITLGKISAGDERIITFQVRIKPTENFQFGTTTLFNTASAKSNDGTISTSTAQIDVTKTGVLGAATTVSTGVGDYILYFGIAFSLAVFLTSLWYLGEQLNIGLVRKFARKYALWKSFVLPRR